MFGLIDVVFLVNKSFEQLSPAALFFLNNQSGKCRNANDPCKMNCLISTSTSSCTLYFNFDSYKTNILYNKGMSKNVGRECYRKLDIGNIT